jgi:hypothetical protein
MSEAALAIKVFFANSVSVTVEPFNTDCESRAARTVEVD